MVFNTITLFWKEIEVYQVFLHFCRLIPLWYTDIESKYTISLLNISLEKLTLADMK